MLLLTLFLDLPLGEGFRFNTNILETNIINLAVVIGIVISFVGDALRSLLENRKQTVLNTLREADQRAREAQEKLNKAQVQVEFCRKKAIEICEQAFILAQEQKYETYRQVKKDVARLEELKNETLNLQQQKALSQIYQQVIALSLTNVSGKLELSVDKKFHSSINNFNIVLLTNYSSK